MANLLSSRCTCLILRPATSFRLASSAAARSPPPVVESNNSNRSNNSPNSSNEPRTTTERPTRPVQNRPTPHRYDQENPRRTPNNLNRSSQSTSYPTSSTPPVPRIPSARIQNNLDSLPNEARRREELYQANSQRKFGGEKVYALSRERARGDSAFERRGTGMRNQGNQGQGQGQGGRFGEGSTNYTSGTRQPTQRTSNRSSPPETRYDPPLRPVTEYQAPPPSSARPNPKFTNNASPDQSSSRPAPKDRHSTALQRKANDRNRQQAFVPKLIPGQFNKSLSVPGLAKKAVLPVVRGGRVSEEGRGRGKGGRKRAEMQKVVLPDTIRLENLTNILGVPLCPFIFSPLSESSADDYG